MKLSILIPAFNEEKTIGIVLQKIDKLKIPHLEKEIVIVDDGSSDKTSEIVRKFIKDKKNIHFYQHEKNQGKGAAIQTGIKNAKGDIILIQDADLEYDPVDIPRLVQPVLDKKAQVVYGTRLRTKPVLFGKNRTPLLLHFFGNKFLSMTTTVLYGYSISDMETGYKVFTKDSLKNIVIHAKSFDFEPEITAKILKKNIRILELDIKTTPRGFEEGKKIHPIKDGFPALMTLIKYRFVS